MPLPTRVVVALASGTAVAALLYLRWRRQSRIASSPLRIVISGGGIGGLATALFLEELLGDAVDVLVFERSAARETDRARGSGVAINPDAHSLFTRLCGDRIPFGRRLALLQLDATGRVIREAPPSDGLRTAHWGWLAAALRDELCRRRARGARLSYEGGVAVEWCYERNVAVDWCYESGHSTSESPSSPVDVTLSDGRTVVADLLIDASGVHSPFREHVDRANTPQYAGYVIYRAQGPAPTFLQEDPPRATFGYARDFHTVSYAIPRPPGGAAAARVVTRCPCCPSAVSADDEDEAEAAERAFDPSRRWYASYVYVAQNAAQAGGLASFEDGQGECRTWGVPQGALNESSALAMARGSVPLRDAAEDDDAVRPLPEPVASLHGAVASSEAGGGPYKQAVCTAARLERMRRAPSGVWLITHAPVRL